MTQLEGSPAGDRNLEKERQPKTLVTLFGMNHHDLNLEVIPKIAGAFEDHLRLSKGEHIFWIENASLPSAQAAIMEREIGNYGLTFSTAKILRPTRALPYRGEVSNNDIKRYIEQIDRAQTVDEIIGRGLLSENDIFYFFLAKKLDDLQKRRDLPHFDIRMESHTPDMIKVIKRNTDEAEKYLLLADQAMGKKDFQSGIHYGHASAYHVFLASTGVMGREEDIGNQMVSQVKEIDENPSGGSEFCIVGFSHTDALTAKIKQELGSSINTVVETKGQRELDPLSLAVNSYRRDNNCLPSDLIVARWLLLHACINAIIGEQKKQARLDKLARLFDTTYMAVSYYVNTLSLEEIRQINVGTQTIDIPLPEIF